jgi:hypothetical protein
MAIITCSTGVDGSLIPTGVEFEAGDLIRFDRDDPSRAALVKSAFKLDRVSALLEDGVPRKDVPGESDVLINVHYPPPGRAGVPPITVSVPPKRTPE